MTFKYLPEFHLDDALEANMTPSQLSEYLSMLSCRRPTGSKTERKFIATFLDPLGVERDDFGNRYLRIGTAPILWSSHTDTVHTHGGTQLLTVHNGTVTTQDPTSNCLGADCTTGVWLMVQMIRAGIEGLYIFHQAEEHGCLGSRWLAKNRGDLLDGIKYAIAFDRMGTREIITHQSGIRVASDAFAASLAKCLGLPLEASSWGAYTDTIEYADIIPECTNIAVGYSHQHSRKEVQNLRHMSTLLDAIVSADFNALVDGRLPGDYDHDVHFSHTKAVRDFMWDDPDATDTLNKYDMESLVRNNADLVAALLYDLGYDATRLADELHGYFGYIRHR